jgi:hypothetical protein
MGLTKQFSRGNCRAGVFESEFNGKKTFSFVFDKMKFNQQTQQAEKTNFFSEADLPDLLVLIQTLAIKSVKEKAVQSRQSVPVQNPQIPKAKNSVDFYESDLPSVDDF